MKKLLSIAMAVLFLLCAFNLPVIAMNGGLIKNTVTMQKEQEKEEDTNTEEEKDSEDESEEKEESDEDNHDHISDGNSLGVDEDGNEIKPEDLPDLDEIDESIGEEARRNRDNDGNTPSNENESDADSDDSDKGKDKDSDKDKDTEEEEEEVHRDLVPPEGTEANAFSKDTNEVKVLYQEEYNWDYSKAKVKEWEDEEFDRSFKRLAGYQEEYLGDSIQLTGEHIGLSEGGSTTGVGGGKIADTALSEVGEEEEDGKVKYNDWYFGKDDYEDTPWSATFISWVMNENGLIDSGFWKKTNSVSKMYQNTSKFEEYKLSETSSFGGDKYEISKGDLIYYYGEEDEGKDFTNVAIVVQVSNDEIVYVGGDIDGKVQKITVTKDNMDSVAKNAVIVAVEYPGGNGVYGTGTEEENKETVFRFLTTELGYNSAAAVGVMANIQGEGGFADPDINEYGGGGGYGLCQWTGTRRVALEMWCRTNGYKANTIEGQLWYLKYENETSETATHEAIQKVENTRSGAIEATRIWLTQWERSLNQGRDFIIRSGYAQSLWSQFGNK